MIALAALALAASPAKNAAHSAIEAERAFAGMAGPHSSGQSVDGTLRWSWGDRGSRGTRLSISLFDGEAMESVFIHDRAAQIQ